MTINGIDIFEFSAKQWRVDQGDVEFENESAWIPGTPLPVLFGNQIGFKHFVVTLMVYGDNRLDIQGKIGKILSLLLEPAELELDGYEHKYMGVLEKPRVTEHTDHSRHRFQVLELSFAGYEYEEMDEQIFNGMSTFEIFNPGDIVSPLILELIPTMGMAEIILTGISRNCESGEDLPVTVKNLTTDKKIVLDGVNGMITEAGMLKASDVDIWALPTVRPGINTITVGTTHLNVTAKVLPLFLY